MTPAVLLGLTALPPGRSLSTKPEITKSMSAFATMMPTVSAALALRGWEVRSVEIDAVIGRMDLDIHRNDGRWIRCRIEDGRCVVERWQREAMFGRQTGTSPGIPTQDFAQDAFLGRSRFDSPIAAFRCVADYIGDNSMRHSAMSGRDIFRPALAAWHKASESPGIRVPRGEGEP